MGSYVLMCAIDINPCNQSVTTLSELGDDDLVKTFVQMMRRKYLDVSGNEMHLNFTPDELISRLDNGPLRELCNSIFYKLHDHRIKNGCEYDCIKSTNLVTKIRSTVSDWESLVAKNFFSLEVVIGELPLTLNDTILQFSRDVCLWMYISIL